MCTSERGISTEHCHPSGVSYASATVSVLPPVADVLHKVQTWQYECVLIVSKAVSASTRYLSERLHVLH
jgi:hypothetical protein